MFDSLPIAHYPLRDKSMDFRISEEQRAFQGLRWKAADMYNEIEAARAWRACAPSNKA